MSDRMSFAEACAELGLSEAELEQLIAAGKIASIKEGNTLYFKREVVQKFKESQDSEPAVLLSDDVLSGDELSLLDDDDSEIDLLADDEATTPTKKEDAKKEEPKKEEPAAAEVSLDEGLPEIDLEGGLEMEPAGESTGDETLLNLDGVLEEDSESTTPVASRGGDDLDMGEETLLDTEVLDLGDEADTFEVDTVDDLTGDLTEEGTLLRGGGARVMQMKRKKSHAAWTALLAVTALLAIVPLGVVIHLVKNSSEVSKEGVTPANSDSWIREFNYVGPAAKLLADAFRKE